MKARINRSDAETIRQALDQLSAKGSVRKEGDEFLVEAEMEAVSYTHLERFCDDKCREKFIKKPIKLTLDQLNDLIFEEPRQS